MPMIAFDSHAHVKRLMEAGFTEAQAEAQTQALLDLLENRLVTKEDIRDLATKHDIAELRQEFKADMAELRQGFKADMTGFRQGFKADLAELHQDFKSETAGVRQEFKTDIALQSDRAVNKLAIWLGLLAAWVAVLQFFG